MSREYPERPFVGVGVVLWRGERVLLIRRGQPPRQGQWSLPGGGQHLGETVTEAALRELREETGLVAEWLDLLTVVDLIEPGPDGRTRFHYTLIDFVGEADQDSEAVAGDDAAALGWFTLAEITGLGLWGETVRIIRLAAERRRPARPVPRATGG